MSKIRIAHLAGPTATIQNTPPLVTSSKARTRAGLPELQRWNDAVFQLAAPQGGQILRSPVQLASFAARPDDLLIAAIDLRGAWRPRFDNWFAAADAPAADARPPPPKPYRRENYKAYTNSPWS